MPTMPMDEVVPVTMMAFAMVMALIELPMPDMDICPLHTVEAALAMAAPMPFASIADVDMDKAIAATAANPASAWKTGSKVIDCAGANTFDPNISGHTTQVPRLACAADVTIVGVGSASRFDCNGCMKMI